MSPWDFPSSTCMRICATRRAIAKACLRPIGAPLPAHDDKRIGTTMSFTPLTRASPFTWGTTTGVVQ
ncbi:hypothetical protein [Methylocystis sp. SC2]|uniref:hypothetical protein n=1 Tax=Methylocystis sp. (strain SC2) TaxID=187303 RepID=UPI0011D1FCCA|nr:hypothetical protein [Methylocystis sp. SC2]